MQNRSVVAVISPFLDKWHGTERCVAEQVERLAQKYEIHLYCIRVGNIDLSKVSWHRIPALPGPHLLAFCWWFVANHLWRWWHRLFRGLRFDLVYTPGINCVDADIISVHAIFSELYREVRRGSRLWRNPMASWPRLIHRRLYYGLIIKLEKLAYACRKSHLTAVSHRTAESLTRFGRDQTPVIYHGIDQERFNPWNRKRLREQCRRRWGFSESTVCMLLVGNGWKNKGLESLLQAVGSIEPADWHLLIVGQDDPVPYQDVIANLGLGQRVTFAPPIPDVEFYYAAADLYVGPSLEDAFGLPPLEAMACGLPVIVSSRSGVSELIIDGFDGLILSDPHDPIALAGMISKSLRNPDLRRGVGENAAKTTLQHTWERNAAELDDLFQQVLRLQRTANLGKVPVVQ